MLRYAPNGALAGFQSACESHRVRISSTKGTGFIRLLNASVKAGIPDK